MPVLRYLSADDVRAAMPGVGERLELARRTLIALVDDAEVPPKFGVHPRPPAAHTAAMPALLRGAAADGSGDLLGMKWVTAFPSNRRMGLDAIHATVVLNDATTGVPRAVLDGAPITAERTAAVSGVALAEWWPRTSDTSAVAVLGAGVQGASHVAVLAEVARGAALTICDRHLDRAQALADEARATSSFATVAAATDLPATAAAADVLLTMISFGDERQTLRVEHFTRARLVVAVDYDMCIPAEFARAASRFLTDDVAQMLATRVGATFAGYPDPDASMGEALLGRAPVARGDGPVYVNHLGVGLADVVFADAIVKIAEERGIGVEHAL